MTEQTPAQGTLASLRIDAEPLYEEEREMQFTGQGDGGPLVGRLTMRTQELRNLRDGLAAVAAKTTPPEGGLWYGRPEQPRVGFNFSGQQGALFHFEFIVAFPTGSEDYRPHTLGAPVSADALNRLVEGLDQILQAGQSVVEWTPAD